MFFVYHGLLNKTNWANPNPCFPQAAYCWKIEWQHLLYIIFPEEKKSIPRCILYICNCLYTLVQTSVHKDSLYYFAKTMMKYISGFSSLVDLQEKSGCSQDSSDESHETFSLGQTTPLTNRPFELHCWHGQEHFIF